MLRTNELIKMGWNFDNSYTRLPELFYSYTNPNPVRRPELVMLNNSLAADLGLKGEELMGFPGAEILAGNELPEGAMPLAQAYAGNQFGHFTRLGDGRAILLGEQITPDGARYDIQLKGAGRTPYSRGGDGRAALGPMLREYIISEAMYALGIPSTRSLAVVTTGEKVYRETPLPGAILTRVASSHIRVGTFEYVSKWGTDEDLRALADYTIERHFGTGLNSDNPYLHLLQEVIKRQAILIAKWQLAGFIHGVMNTDNMLLSGETIDYGPCAFMDTYDPETVFSSIDTQGRYAYGNQPLIAAWNLARFAETLLPLLHEDTEAAVKVAEQAVQNFYRLYHDSWLKGMGAKLGLFRVENDDEPLILGLLAIMEKYAADYTNTFRALTIGRLHDAELFEQAEFSQWHEVWQDRLKRQTASAEAAQDLMRRTNPAVIPRNHRVEEALQAAVVGDFSVMKRLVYILSIPFAYSPAQDEYSSLPEASCTPYQTFCGT